MDDAVNLGGIGVVIGHELTHGFDDQGRKFDPQGNLRDWWTDQDGEEFEKRASCMADEYSSFHCGGRSEAERQTHAGREYRRQRRSAIALMALEDRIAKDTDRQCRSEDRRLHAGAAILPGFWPCMVQAQTARKSTHTGDGRPAFTGTLPRQRRSAEHA